MTDRAYVNTKKVTIIVMIPPKVLEKVLSPLDV